MSVSAYIVGLFPGIVTASLIAQDELAKNYFSNYKFFYESALIHFSFWPPRADRAMK